MYDVIIIGAGPAGISAGIYTKRAGANVLVLYYGSSELKKAGRIDNYYGMVNGISGEELYFNGIEQAKNLEIELMEKEVLDIDINEDFTFEVNTTDEKFSTKSIIIATGNKKIRPNINGLAEYEGRGVSYCAICDGFFYKSKSVAVIGNGTFALNEASSLESIASGIRILTNGEDIVDNDLNKYEIDKRKISKIYGEGKVESIEFEDGEKLNIDGIFIAQGIASGLNFAKKLGIVIENDSIKTDENMKTNIEGIFACGDLTGGLLQVNKAVYEGAKAGLGAVKFIKE